MMHEELGISEKSFSELSDKVGLKAIYDFSVKYMPGHIGLYHYIDARGRFIPNKYRQDIIASAIFDELTTKDKMPILQYMEDMENGEL